MTYRRRSPSSGKPVPGHGGDGVHRRPAGAATARRRVTAVRCLSRSPERLRDHPWARPRRDREGRRVRRPLGGRGARGRRRRVLPGALRSGSGPTIRGDRSPHGAGVRARRRARPKLGAAGLPRRARARRRGALAAPAITRRRSATSSSASGTPTDRVACSGDSRFRLGVLRDAPLPDRTPARDDHAEVGAQPDPANRHPRRPPLSRRLRRCARPTSTVRSTLPDPTS